MLCNLPYEARLRDEDSIRENGLSSWRIAQLIQKVKSQKKLLILDTCHAGAAGEILLALRGAADQEAILRLSKAIGVGILTAAKAEQYAMEIKDLGHGIFTYAILEGIKGAAAKSGEKTVSVHNLIAYTDKTVKDLSKKFFGGIQEPLIATFGEDYPIAIVKEK